MIVAMCCTKNWYQYLAISIYSLRQTNKIKKIYCFIEDDNIPYIDNVEFINVNKIKEYITKESPNYNTQYSKMSYIRCYFSKILKEDKILYLDVDALVIDNIKELWDMDIKDNALIGVHEGGEWNKHLNTYGLDDTYINSGVLIMNLKLIRDEKLDDSMIYLLNNNWYAFPDQDVLNLVCRNRIKHVSIIYNSSETTGIVDNAKIVHYIRGNKGWKRTSPRSEIWYNWFNKYIKEGDNMYIVKAIYCFTDNEVGTVRQIGEEWEVSKERYEYLAGGNEKGITAVELVGIKKIEEPKLELPKFAKEIKIKKVKEVKTIKKPKKSKEK